MEDNFPQRRCEDCNAEFEDSFQLIDHLLPEDEEFNPYYILPNGYKLLLGSLLRFFHYHATEPEQIQLIAQSTYVTLFSAELGYEATDELIQDMIVSSAMKDFDKSFNKLLEGEDDGGISKQ